MSFTITAVGDISLGDHPVRAGYGTRTALRTHGAQLFGDVSHLLQDSDVTLGNLETVASNEGLHRYWLPSYEMRGNPESISILKSVGFDILGVANNHALQHGEPAFLDTVKRIHSIGMSTIGIDDENGTILPQYITANGQECCFVGISMRPESWTDGPIPYSYRSDMESAIQDVLTLRQSYDGHLICSVHWGLEFLHKPTASQICMGRSLIDAGVDVVFGHHPHVLQPVERYGSGLIFYSLGNFLFDLWPESMRHSLIAKVQLSVNGPHEFTIHPIYIDKTMAIRTANSEQADFIKGIVRTQIQETTPVISELADLDRSSNDDYALARRAFRYDSYRYLLRNLHRSPLIFSLQQILRTLLRRLTLS